MVSNVECCSFCGEIYVYGDQKKKNYNSFNPLRTKSTKNIDLLRTDKKEIKYYS